jgi:hypothetical protein
MARAQNARRTVLALFFFFSKKFKTCLLFRSRHTEAPACERAETRMSLTHAFAVVASNLRRVRSTEDAARLYAAFLLYIVRSSLR